MQQEAMTGDTKDGAILHQEYVLQRAKKCWIADR
jgi:hypothetical protein